MLIKQVISRQLAAVLLLVLILLPSCSTETSCGTDIFGKKVTCTESTGLTDEVSTLFRQFWVLILFGGLVVAATVWAAIDDRSKAKRGTVQTQRDQRPANAASSPLRSESVEVNGNSSENLRSAETARRRPSTVLVADLEPGDLVADPTGQAVQVREITWVSETHIKLIYANGFMDVLAATRTLTKLPPPLR